MERKLLLANTVLLVVVAAALGLHFVTHARESARQDQSQRQTRQIVAKAAQQALRLRSQSNLRGLAMGLLNFQSSHGAYPDHDDWQALLIESDAVTPEMFQAPGDHQGVDTAYHYLGPLDANAADGFARALPLLCEDPALWDDGGWIVYTDTITQWATHAMLKELIANAPKNR